jgi:hypothetical protein
MPFRFSISRPSSELVRENPSPPVEFTMLAQPISRGEADYNSPQLEECEVEADRNSAPSEKAKNETTDDSPDSADLVYPTIELQPGETIIDFSDCTKEANPKFSTNQPVFTPKLNPSNTAPQTKALPVSSSPVSPKAIPSGHLTLPHQPIPSNPQQQPPTPTTNPPPQHPSKRPLPFAAPLAPCAA